MPAQTINCDSILLTANDKLFLCALYLEPREWKFESEIGSEVRQIIKSSRSRVLTYISLRSTDDVLTEMHATYSKFSDLGIVGIATRLHPIKRTPHTAYQIVECKKHAAAIYGLLECIALEFYGSGHYIYYCADTLKAFEELLTAISNDKNNNLETLYQQKVVEVLAL